MPIQPRRMLFALFHRAANWSHHLVQRGEWLGQRKAACGFLGGTDEAPLLRCLSERGTFRWRGVFRPCGHGLQAESAILSRVGIQMYAARGVPRGTAHDSRVQHSCAATWRSDRGCSMRTSHQSRALLGKLAWLSCASTGGARGASFDRALLALLRACVLHML